MPMALEPIRRCFSAGYLLRLRARHRLASARYPHIGQKRMPRGDLGWTPATQRHRPGMPVSRTTVKAADHQKAACPGAALYVKPYLSLHGSRYADSSLIPLNSNEIRRLFAYLVSAIPHRGPHPALVSLRSVSPPAGSRVRRAALSSFVGRTGCLLTSLAVARPSGGARLAAGPSPGDPRSARVVRRQVSVDRSQ